MVFEIGRLCVKTAGRDAMGFCVVVDKIDDKYVLIDGDVRRKKCNILHLEPLNKKFDIKKGASTEEILTLFEKENIIVKRKKLNGKNS